MHCLVLPNDLSQHRRSGKEQSRRQTKNAPPSNIRFSLSYASLLQQAASAVAEVVSSKRVGGALSLTSTISTVLLADADLGSQCLVYATSTLLPADADLGPQSLVYVVEKRPMVGLSGVHMWVGSWLTDG